jgi:hypothetical protein
MENKEFTKALVSSLKNKEFIKATIEISLKVHKEEANQILYVADYMRNEVLNEIQMGKENFSTLQITLLLPDIMYRRSDYFEAAKELTRLYKENQKNLINKVA